jgi:hypothetical protein
MLNGGQLTAEVVMTLDTDGNVIDQSWTSPMMDQYEPITFAAPMTTVGELQIISAACATRNAAAQIPVAPGVCVGRVRLTNSVPFLPQAKANLAFKFTGYSTIQLAFLGGSGVNLTTDETANGTYLVSGLTNPVINDAPLPVEISSFASAVQGRTVVLNWSTATEKNSNRFEIERSLATSSNWSSVASVKASVLSNSTKSYTYSDTKLQTGKYQYRLKMIDNDGTFSYSKVQTADIASPKEFSVSQNYPNPFNPSTTIAYQIPVDSKVVMEIYNIAGQRVSELVNQDMSAGYYTANFGASKLASGVYIYRVMAVDKVSGNNFSSIKKMMLLK